MNLKYENAGSQEIRVLTPNNTVVGFLIMDVDGYFYFWPSNEGCWSAHMMRTIANKLDEVNKKWDDHITEYFSNKENSNENN